MDKYKYILFDLDGTIIDPKEGITNSLKYSLDKLGIKDYNDEILLSFIGPPLKDSFKSYFSLNEQQIDKAVTYYREFFNKDGLFQNYLYEGIEDLLSSLKDKGLTLFIATSKPTVFAEKIIKMFKLEKYFDGIIGSELDGSRSAKSEIIGYILEEKSLDKEKCLMVGDRMHDILGANKQDIDSMAVLYGYGSIDEFSELKPTYIVSSVKEIEQKFLGVKEGV